MSHEVTEGLHGVLQVQGLRCGSWHTGATKTPQTCDASFRNIGVPTMRIEENTVKAAQAYDTRNQTALRVVDPVGHLGSTLLHLCNLKSPTKPLS